MIRIFVEENVQEIETMAHPAVFIAPPKNGGGSENDIRDAAEKRADAMGSALEVLQLLDDRGVLNLLRGMSTTLDSPDAIRSMRNFILLTKLFGNVPPDVLNGLVTTVKAGAEREKAHRAPGLLQLLRRLRSANTRHALAVALDLVEGVGKRL